MQSANQVVKTFGRPVPVDPAFVLLEFVCIRRLTLVLRYFLDPPGRHIVERRDEQRRTQSRQVALDLVARFISRDGSMLVCEHRSRVERLHDAHDGHAGFALAGDDSAMDRCRATIPRQERRVNVDEAVFRRSEDLVSQNLSVRGDDAKIGSPRPPVPPGKPCP